MTDPLLPLSPGVGTTSYALSPAHRLRLSADHTHAVIEHCAKLPLDDHDIAALIDFLNAVRANDGIQHRYIDSRLTLDYDPVFKTHCIQIATHKRKKNLAVTLSLPAALTLLEALTGRTAVARQLARAQTGEEEQETSL